jgi:hypothetical protein
MCRFLVYQGNDEILLSKLILDPTHSILKQSFDSRLRLVSWECWLIESLLILRCPPLAAPSFGV